MLISKRTIVHRLCFLVLWLGCGLLLALPPASAARFLYFQAISSPSGDALAAGGQIILRLRSGMKLNRSLASLATDLNRYALEGLLPQHISWQSAPSGAKIAVKGKPFLFISPQTAQAAKATPKSLAIEWTTRLQRIVATAYVALEPRTSLAVPLGEIRVLRWGGTARLALSFTIADAEIANLQLDEAQRRLLVRGLKIGATTIMAKTDEDTLLLPVEVKAWAARVSAPAIAEVTSPPLPPDDLRRVIRNAVLNAVQLAPPARLRLGEPRRQNNHFSLWLRAEGEGCFPVETELPVEVRVLNVPLPLPPQLLVSNYPEKITAPGVLMRERLLGKTPVRLLWHHVNKSERPLRFVVRLANLGASPARIHITESASGPHFDEIFVGHQAMRRYLQLEQQGEGYVLRVPANRLLELYDVHLPPQRIVSGLARITPLEGDNLLLEVLADGTWPQDAYFPLLPEMLPNNPPLTFYSFDAEKNIVLNYEAGGPWTFFHIGKDYSSNLQGQKLYGDYGVRYTITIQCQNRTLETARCALSLRASGGVARMSYCLYGQLRETKLLQAGAEEIIERFELSPGEQRQLKLITMPESGSHYPITLAIRSL